jgi:hypothetical protein
MSEERSGNTEDAEIGTQSTQRATRIGGREKPKRERKEKEKKWKSERV